MRAEDFIMLGIAFIFLGFFLTFIGALASRKTEFAFGGFIGPFLFGFASKPEMLQIIIALSLIFLIIFFFLPILLKLIR